MKTTLYEHFKAQLSARGVTVETTGILVNEAKPKLLTSIESELVNESSTHCKNHAQYCKGDGHCKCG